MTEATWRAMLDVEHIDNLNDPSAFWIRMCHRIKANTERKNKTGEGECIGFDVIHDSKGRYRIVDGTTQVPMTKWHTSYGDALEELESCRISK